MHHKHCRVKTKSLLLCFEYRLNLHMKHFSFVIIFFLFIATATFTIAKAQAQTLPQNLSQVDVSSLSDAQVRQLMQQAEAAGLSDNQLIRQAEERGMTTEQGNLLGKRIANIRNAANVDNSADTTLTPSQRRLNYKPDTTYGAKRNKGRNDSSLFVSNLIPHIFGADLFRNNNLTFEPNLNIATPVNYILGPHDQVDISVYGNSQVNWKLDVSPEGNINIPGIGIVNVAGKTIEQATSIIKSKLAAGNYAIGRGTNVQVALGNIRSIKVIMVGQLQRPGTYTLPSLASVFNALYAAGGPNENGSFRQIEIIRDNRVIRHLDIYDFLLKGDQSNNITLQDQDVVRVPTYRVRVEMRGEVKTPALFEVLPGETLQDVIRFAGGFSNEAYTALIKVSQISDQQRRITDVPEVDFKNYLPLRGDIYTVSRILNRYENRVTINGAVFRPGEYELDKGLTLSGLIKKAAGLKEDAFTGRGSITRLEPDNTTQLLSFNVTDVMNNPSADILLQREDVVNISSIFDLKDKYTVTIKGDVRRSGEYAYADSMSVQDLIIKAGGFMQGASTRRIEVARRVTNSDPTSKSSPVAQVFTVDADPNLGKMQADFRLKPFDIVSIYTLPGYETQRTIKVEGEVVYPGYYAIQKKNERISDIIARAGGLTASADADGGTLRRENIAILGISKNKTDTAAVLQEQAARFNHLKQSYRDSTSASSDETQMRNNYVGINLPAILNKPGTNADLIVEDGDIIRIPKEEQIVRVNGEVLYPSAVVYSKNKSFKGYILNAGGYSPNALKRGAYIVYPNGTVKGTGKFLFFNTHPDVKPGSEIYVPKHPPRVNGLQSLIGLSSILASLGAIIIGIVSISK